MNASRLFFVTFCAALTSAAFAQPAGGPPGASASVSVEYGFSSGENLSDEFVGKRSDGIDISRFAVGASQSYRVGERSSLSLKAEYERFDLDLDPRSVPLPEEAQSFSLGASLRHPLNEKWVLIGSVTPGFHNSDSGFDSGGFGVNVSALGLYRASDTLTWAFGVIYRSLAEDDLRVLPAIGFDWRPNSQWAVSVGFPRSSVTYAASDRLRLSLGVAAQGGTFYIKDEIRASLSGTELVLRDTLLDYTEIRVGVGAEYRLTPSLELSASVGMIVHQDFDYFERDYELEADSGAPYAAVGVKYSF